MVRVTEQVRFRERVRVQISVSVWVRIGYVLG